jgi:hypothetical protein
MKRFKVIRKNLNKVWGYAVMDTNTIEIDVNARGKKEIEILIHEMVHLLWNNETEKEVERKSILMTNTLWQQKYRRVDDTNKEPLQDGTK